MIDKKESEENRTKASHYNDLEVLTRTELRRKYKSEYDSWRNRKAKARPDGHWSAEFDDFPDFLRHMGPIPEKGMTCDRIDHNNPTYGPGLCKWSTKREQANNRSSTIMVPYLGTLTPLSDAARAEGQSPSTVRQRMARGWSATDALSGVSPDGHPVSFGKEPQRYRPWPTNDDPGNSEKWERLWVASGGYRSGNSRLEYLLKSLRAEHSKLSAEMFEYYEKDPEDYYKSTLYVAKHEICKRIEKLIAEAEAMLPQWQAAVRQFEARREEKRAVQNNNYFIFEDPNDR